MQVGAVAGVGRDREGLLVEPDRLIVSAERGRPLTGGTQRDSGLRGQRVSLGPLLRVCMGGEVMPGEGAGELVRIE